MDHAALSALEAEVHALRVLVAEKSVHARSMDEVTPPSAHAPFATFILAAVVLVAFVVGRYGGIAHARAIGPRESTIEGVAFITLQHSRGSEKLPVYSLTLDTKGKMIWNGTAYVARPGYAESHVSEEDVRALVLDMMRGCFGQTRTDPVPFGRLQQTATSTITLRVNGQRFIVVHAPWQRDDFERRIEAIANIPALAGPHP